MYEESQKVTSAGLTDLPAGFFERSVQRLLGSTRSHFLFLTLLLIKRELQVKYRDSALGYLWSMLNPLLTMMVITFVFSHLVRGVENYSMFILTGLLFWNMASQSLAIGVNSIVTGGNLMRKVRVPGWVFPLTSLGSAGTNLLLSFIPYTVLFLYFGIKISANVVYLLPITILYFAFIGGLILTLASFNVFFRDVSHVLEPVLGLIFYATPIVYARTGNNIPPVVQQMLLFNPFTHFIEAFRGALMNAQPVTMTELGIMTGIASASLAIGTLVYRHYKRKFIFVL
jgi:ABC-type polysaccharide/polyol phosphate export permease